jgi:phosphoribosylformylglycinamidine (FGAM) synthase-like enzyme
MFSSCASVEQGGMIISLAKMAIAGKLGANINIENINKNLSSEQILYSESQSRFIVAINPELKEEFEKEMQNHQTKQIGKVTEKDFVIKNKDEKLIETDVDNLEKIYKKRFRDY